MTTLKERCIDLPHFSREGITFVPYWKEFEGLMLLCEVSRTARTEDDFKQFFDTDRIKFYPYYVKPSGFHPALSKFVGRCIISQYDELHWEDAKIVAALIKAADEMAPLIKAAVERRKVWISRPVKHQPNQCYCSDRSFDRWTGWRLDRDEE